ncbi:MAG TPA: DUF4037 domain-containing protein [Acidimicrobiales bacterium]|nr:DUF4037 domain-containing protein [Acidimicrobiales bacterium]
MPTGAGIELARRYFERLVRPVLAGRFPRLPYAAARLGSGSDVLGLDDEVSRDHDWGCRLHVVLETDDADAAADVEDALDRELPDTFEGHPVRFATSWSPRAQLQVEITSVAELTRSRLGLDATRPLDPLDWLVMTGQSVLEVIGGAVFFDGPGTLTRVRNDLAWYPDEVWRLAVAADWARLEQELPFVVRTASRNDEPGSRVIAARLVRVQVHLAFLLSRRWPPYPKWEGTAFRELAVAAELAPRHDAVLVADDPVAREGALCDGAGVLARRQRSLALPAPDEVIVPFHDRPIRTVSADLADGLLDSVTDPVLRALPRGMGTVEQWVDNVDLLSWPSRRATLRSAYEAIAAAGGADPARPIASSP